MDDINWLIDCIGNVFVKVDICIVFYFSRIHRPDRLDRIHSIPVNHDGELYKVGILLEDISQLVFIDQVPEFRVEMNYDRCPSALPNIFRQRRNLKCSCLGELGVDYER